MIPRSVRGRLPGPADEHRPRPRKAVTASGPATHVSCGPCPSPCFGDPCCWVSRHEKSYPVFLPRPAGQQRTRHVTEIREQARTGATDGIPHGPAAVIHPLTVGPRGSSCPRVRAWSRVASRKFPDARKFRDATAIRAGRVSRHENSSPVSATDRCRSLGIPNTPLRESAEAPNFRDVTANRAFPFVSGGSCRLAVASRKSGYPPPRFPPSASTDRPD